MAEAIGLTVGFIGLAGLFSTCVDCFKLVQVYSARSCDYETLQTMLDNQQFHFMAWGKACGFMDTDRAKSRFDDPLSGPRNRRIEQTMERIIALLTDGESLKKKYGLKAQRAPVGSKLIEGPALSAFSKAFQNTKDFWNTSLQRKTHITGTLRWAVDDKDKFDRLIQNLRDLLSDLMRFTEDIGVPDREHLIVEYEFEMIDDEPSLEAITAASACDDDDLLSSVASRRLSRVKAQSVANQSVKFDDSVSMASFARYTPSISTLVEEEVEGVVQEIGVMRVSISQWRKVKTRAGIMPWLKTIVVATGSSPGISELGDDIQPLSRANTLSDDLDSTATSRPVRVAINSQVLINTLRKITAYRFSSNHNVLIHPFKPLIVYENDLRRYIADMQEKLRVLEEAHRKEPAEADDPSESELGIESKTDENPALEIEKTRRTVQELECLLDFMDNDMSELLQICKQMRDQSLQKISFENLWLVFRPGTIAISRNPTSDHNDRAYQILHVTGGRPILDVDNNSRSEGLGNSEDLDYDNFDGTSYGPRPHKFVISEFTGERDVLSLPLCPISQSSFAMELRVKLLDRGKRFLQCTERGRYYYSGLVLKEWDPNHRDACTFCARNIIIDNIAAMEQCRSSGCIWNPSFGGGVIAKATKANNREAFETVDCSIPKCKTCTDIFNDAIIDLKLRDKFLRSSRNLKAMHQKELGEDQLLLLPYRICGYSLHHRKWFPLNVSLLQEVLEPVDLLEKLVLPDEHKAMLLALIRSQVQNAPQYDDGLVDVVQGKGRGVLILLHGAPGTGKTLAAEAVAASLKRPLLPVRIADLGSVSREIEQNLSQFVTLAERWGCILLVQDADAILAQRTRTDREGNNITSTFIDALEYFTGILIFTTNRVGDFDEAIKSRIHLTLYFPPFNLEAVIKLWKNLLDQLREGRVDFDSKEILRFAERQYNQKEARWNGREIRNAIATAVALAQEDAKFSGDEKVVLKKGHFEAIARSSQTFSNYLRDIRGGEDSATAYLRNDSYTPQTPKQNHRTSTNYDRPDHWSDSRAVEDYDDNFNPESTQPDVDDLEVQELEIQLKMAKLKRQQKALRARYVQPSP
ncbi:hypothetical protein K432DRAFT_355692 [Lepidopterella palustris CBS 459.81]|uniref:AAA+ ATPase domain-containing protein n=1 Tax=Lepidopterella palustris CBS 459.81 TaxID=1314670 RepID=A0A8E2E8F3_9PEZI|nr:hypothetical protein K432DRAFT_355692 [Lepidopterella palustris CBS 459.81]